MEVTKREILFSIIIVFVMLILGIFSYNCIQNSSQEKLAEYYKAVKIESDEQFQYSLRTSIGNALVYGNITAKNPVSFDEYDGEYYYIKRISEHYTRHTRTVTSTDSKGKTTTKTEEYYTWDVVEEQTRRSEQFTFKGSDFSNQLLGLPYDRSNYIKMDFDDRCYFEFVPASFSGTIAMKIGQGKLQSFTGGTELTVYPDKLPNEVITSLETSIRQGNVIFGILWIMLTAACIIAFYYLDNKWLEE